MSPRAFVPLLLAATIFCSDGLYAQKRADRNTIKRLKEDIGYLASDELEGRRTGSEGERKALNYIKQRYEQMGIPGYKGKFVYPFTFTNGKDILPATSVSLNSKKIKIPEDGFPLPFSANGKAFSEVMPNVLERGNIWLMPLYNEKDEATDAHFDWEKAAYERTQEAIAHGATGVVFFDSYDAKYDPEFNRKSEYESLEIPVAYIGYEAYRQYLMDEKSETMLPSIPVTLNVSIEKTEITGHNVAAYIDNDAPYTVVLGAHYDHLGYGEDGNSLHAAKDHQVHNGADDNASGTAAILELARRLDKGDARNYNYLFVHFSGEEMGLIGSKAIVQDAGLDSTKIAYMINLDMVGRLNDSTHALTIGGVGTSPVWGKFISKDNRNFKINIDSSGVGPSDHSSFYYAGVPVVFFFTGTHRDYHKPSDDAHKINYEGENEIIKYIYALVENMDEERKPRFTPTKQTTVGKVRFKVTLGIMPDYSFQDGGVRIDGVSEDRPAIKAGMQAGDIIVQMGEHEINGMQSYMKALGAFEEGEETEVTVMRNNEPVKLKVVF